MNCPKRQRKLFPLTSLFPQYGGCWWNKKMRLGNRTKRQQIQIFNFLKNSLYYQHPTLAAMCG